jgi:hypothetical protein
MAIASYDTAPDGNIASEGAFLINVGSCMRKERKAIIST